MKSTYEANKNDTVLESLMRKETMYEISNRKRMLDNGSLVILRWGKRKHLYAFFVLVGVKEVCLFLSIANKCTYALNPPLFTSSGVVFPHCFLSRHFLPLLE